MKKINEVLEKYYKETVRKDMMSMGYNEPRITYWGYVSDKDASYQEGDPVLTGWVSANNYDNQVYVDLEGGDIWYSGDSSIHYSL